MANVFRPKAGQTTMKVGDRTAEERKRTFEEKREDIRWRQEVHDKRMKSLRDRRKNSDGSGGITITTEIDKKS